MYDTGQGVPQDYVQAHKWVNLAASRTTPGEAEDYRSARDELAEEMTASQVAVGGGMATEHLGATEGGVNLAGAQITTELLGLWMKRAFGLRACIIDALHSDDCAGASMFFSIVLFLQRSGPS